MFGQNNNYGAYPYQNHPYSYGATGYSSPMYQQPQQPMNTNKLYATSIEDVRSRQLPPNSDFIFLDNDKPIVYRKTTDATGKMDIQVFEIKPYQQEQPATTPAVDLSQFALKTDIQDLRSDLEQLRESLKTEYVKQVKKSTGQGV